MTQINKNMIWNSVGNTAYNWLQWLITVITARKLGMDSAGVLSLAMSVSLIFRSVTYFGTREFLVTDREGKYSFSDYFGLRTLCCIFSFALCAIFAALNGYSHEQLAAILLYMIFRLSEGLSDIIYAELQKKERLDKAGMLISGKAVITTAAFMAGFYLGDSLILGLLLMSVSSMLYSLAAELPSLKVSIERLSFKKICQLAIETFPVFIYLLENSVIFNAPKYLLSKVSDEASVGLYSSLFSFILIIHALFQYLYFPYITVFTKMEGGKNYADASKLAAKLIIGLIIVAVIFSAAALAYGNTVFMSVFNTDIDISPFLIPAILSVCTYSALTFFASVTIIKRDLKCLIIGYLIGILLYIPTPAIFIPMWGINGASLGMFLAAASTTLFLVIRNRKIHLL